MTVTLTIDGHEYTITTVHAASSYGLPVVLRDGELTDLQATLTTDE